MDGANVSLKLPGAEFGVWESNYPATRDIETAMKEDEEEESAPLWTYTTDENGKFEIMMGDHGYEEGKIYFFKETKAPEGYELPSKTAVNYFYFSYPTVPPTAMKPANLGSASRSQTITNDLPNLEVTKLWKNLKGDNLNKDKIDVDAIDFVVYQQVNSKNQDGTLTPIGAETRFPDESTVYTIEYTSGNWTKVSIPNAPAMGKDEEGNFIYYTYRVEEDTPEGWVSSVDFSDSGREATITNTPEPMEITIKKKWEAPQAMALIDPNNDHVRVKVKKQKDDGTLETFVIEGKDEVRLDNSNNFEKTVQVESGGTYTVEEVGYQFGTKTSGFTLSYEVEVDGVTSQVDTISEPGTITLKNTYDQPYLEVNKVWDTDSETDDLTAKVKIFSRLIGTETWNEWKEIELNKNNKWCKVFEGSELPVDAAQYEYYIVETSVSGNSTGNHNDIAQYTVKYSATEETPQQGLGSMTVTNTKYDGEISVRKEWEYIDGSTIAKEGDNAKVILQRALADKEGFKVSLNVLNKNYNGGFDTQNLVVVVQEHDNVVFGFNSFWGGNTARTDSDSGSINFSNDGGTLTISDVTQDMAVTVSIGEHGNGCSKGKVTVNSSHESKLIITGDYEDVPGTEVVLDSTNQWSSTWKNLPIKANDTQEYVYTVREIQVNGKMLSKADFTSSVTGGGIQEGTVTVTNTEIAYGSLKITKKVTVDGKEISAVPTALKNRADGTYTFRIDDETGKKVETVQITITDGVSDTIEVPNLIEGTYTITETASDNPGVTIDMTPQTVRVVGGKKGSEVPEISFATVTNDYSATGSVPFEAKKVFEDEQLEGNEFEFTLTEYTDSNFTNVKQGGVSQTKNNDSEGNVLFDDISYTISDAGVDAEHPNYFYYTIKETKGTNPDIVYDETVYKYTVSVYDNGDGTLTVSKRVDPTLPDGTPEGYDALFTNQKVVKTTFEFKKIWKASNTSTEKMAWPDGKDISVTLYRNAEYTSKGVEKTVAEQPVDTYAIPVTGIADKKITVSHDAANKWYTVKFDELEKYVPAGLLEEPDNDKVEWEYYIKENPLEGFNTAYGDASGTADSSKQIAKNAESVINSSVSYELPESGGPGTKLFYGLGISFVGFAGLLLFIKRRELRDLSKRRW